MPARLIQLLFTVLILLFFVVIPLVRRARNARSRQRGGEAPRKKSPEPPPAPAVPVALAVPAAFAAPATMPAAGTLSTVVPQAAAAAPFTPALPDAWQVERAAPQQPPQRKPRSPGGLPERLRALPELQRAVAWAEILGPPRSLEEQPPR